MKSLVVVQHEWSAILCSLTNETQDMNQIAETQANISLLPACTSSIFSSRILHSASILNSLNIT
jgi:hypothetical protein